MSALLGGLVSGRFRALLAKEFRQILRDRRLVFSLTVAPVLQLLLLGSVLNADVSNVSLGVVDDSGTPESRELVAELTQSRSFRLGGYYLSADRLGAAISRGTIDAGVVIPHDFARDLVRGRPVTVQFLLNAMNVNTAQISRGYAEGVVQAYSAGLAAQGLHATFRRIAAPAVSERGAVVLAPAFLFNPGLVSSWFITTGVFGMLLILNGTLISSTVMLKEREFGTIEQLLMSPASTAEVILAKIAPVFVLLSAMALLALGLIRVAFHVPFQGSVIVVLGGSGLCLLSGIGLGTLLATFTQSAAQALLTVFFINPPLTSLSGALMPVEAMPRWMQPLVVVNPIYHFGRITRGALIKGSGFETLWPNFVALLVFTAVLLSLSVWRFRRQLG
ncbi:MAG TPA: ABC transporter permease [bacterium]|nr:ABC transporter permease [bacterium]